MNGENHVQLEEKMKSTLDKEEEIDKDTFIYEIDQWEKSQASGKNNQSQKLKTMKTQMYTHQKSKSYSSQSSENITKRKLKLPTLVQKLNEKQNFESKYLINQEEIFKKFKKEIYTDETFRKLIMSYTKSSSSMKENQERERSIEEEIKETVEDLKNEIQGFFTTKANENAITIIEKAKYLEQMRSKIHTTILKKIKNCEAYINNKQITTILFRKENSYIIEKMSKIKHLVLFYSLKKINQNII